MATVSPSPRLSPGRMLPLRDHRRGQEFFRKADLKMTFSQGFRGGDNLLARGHAVPLAGTNQMPGWPSDMAPAADVSAHNSSGRSLLWGPTFAFEKRYPSAMRGFNFKSGVDSRKWVGGASAFADKDGKLLTDAHANDLDCPTFQLNLDGAEITCTNCFHGVASTAEVGLVVDDWELKRIYK